MVHDEECKVATDAFDPHTEPRPHAGVLFEAGAIQTRRRLYSDTVIARRTADARKRQQRVESDHRISDCADSLPIPRPPRSRRAGFLLTRKSSVLGIRIPPLPFVVPDHRGEIEPDNNVPRTMHLGLGFAGKRLERKRGNGERQTDDQTGD